jgi:acetyl esterase/lipase
MPSKQIEAVAALYRSWGAAWAANPQMPLDEWRNMVEGWSVLTSEPGAVDYIETQAAAVSAMWAIPKGCADDRVIVGLHGGGFVTGSMYTHRKLFAHIAKAAGARALIVNFRRTPEHPYPAAVFDALAAYRWLLDQGIKPNHIAFAADSAGGGLTVSALLHARERGLPVPAAAMLMSPWLDVELTGESWTTNASKETLFKSKESVHRLTNMYLGADGDRRDPLVNPFDADLAGFAPVYLQVGGDEVLLDDSRRFAAYAEACGVEARLDVFPEMQHTFQMCAGLAPEANDAIARFAAWVRPKLGLDRVNAAREAAASFRAA